MSRSVARKSLRAREHHQPSYVPTGDNLKILAREYRIHHPDLVSRCVVVCIFLKKITEIMQCPVSSFFKLTALNCNFFFFLLAFLPERGLDVLTQTPIKFVL